MHRNSSIRVIQALLFAAALLSCSTNPSPPNVAASNDPVIGVVNGKEITLSELDEWIRNDLFEKQSSGAPSKLYELRSQSLEQMIDQSLIAAAAAEGGLSESDFIQAEVAALGPIADETISDFYEKHKLRLESRGDLVKVTPQIRQFLESEQPKQVTAKLREAAAVKINLDPPRIQVAATGPSQGPSQAPVTIVEFSDYQCPYCARVEPTLQALLKRYPDQLRLVYRHLPLGFHKNARPAAEASVCAESQGLFWEYHALLFQNQKALAADDLRDYAQQVGLDVDAFETCLTDLVAIQEHSEVFQVFHPTTRRSTRSRCRAGGADASCFAAFAANRHSRSQRGPRASRTPTRLQPLLRGVYRRPPPTRTTRG